eukprot:scaffold22779_cov137-Cylindrotheca_fusiformis.AAC.1
MATAMPQNVAEDMGGMGDLKEILNSSGPVVNAVLLSARDGVVKDLQVDTTPKKQMVKQILGGPFTFLGQYEDEGIMLMMRKDQDDLKLRLPINKHKLQPPFQESVVHGDILAIKVASEEEEAKSSAVMSNEEFFLDYTKDEYEKFAARTDIQIPKPPPTKAPDTTMSDEGEESEEEEEEEVDGESDSEDEEGGFMAVLMGQVIERFQQEHGRMPNEQELQALESAISQKLGASIPE